VELFLLAIGMERVKLNEAAVGKKLGKFLGKVQEAGKQWRLSSSAII
jgi:hypothetical protein